MAKVTFYKGWKPTKKGDIISFGDLQGIFGAQMRIDTRMKPDVPGASADDLPELLKEAQRLGSRRAATYAKNRMKAWLSIADEGNVGIGFQGRAAAALYVNARPIESKGGVLYTVRVKNNTPDSNYYIRHGLPAGAGSSTHQPDEIKMKWVKDRGLRYLPNDTRKNEEEKTRSIMHAVWNKIAENGTSSYYPENLPQAEGRKFFNYPQKYLDDNAANDTEYVARRLFNGERGLKLAVDSIIMGSLSSARFQSSGHDSINTKNYKAGTTGRARGKWADPVAFAAFNSDEE